MNPKTNANNVGWDAIEPHATKLRENLLRIMSVIENESRDDNLPQISETFSTAAGLLDKPDYDIVVCGEVKKGKSTFINALIGKELLPTGVKETTSQVFRISNNQSESFSLIFTDGTSEPISKEQLTRYGSQVDADLKGEPVFKNKQLDYIQINTPIEFLPQHVHIVDTPGLGALYKSHELITHRYIQNAAAVVFVIEPSQPLVQQEKIFLEKVFAVTPYVMFVMTKIDCFDEEHWVTQISRTETLLKESFQKSCYTTPKVLPIASTTLFEAANEKEADAKEEQIEFSYFPAVYSELMKVMYTTVGLSRTRFAWNESIKQKTRVLSSLDEQCKMITCSSKEEQDKIREKKVLLRKEFEELWGPSSIKRKEVMKEIEEIIIGVKNRAAQLTSTTSTIYKKYLEEINTLNSIDSIADYCKNGFKKIVKEISTEWQAIATSAQREVMTALYVIHAEIEKINDNSSFSTSEDIETTSLTFGEKFQSFKSKYFDAAISSTVGATLLGLAGLAIAPFAPLIFIGTVVFGFIVGSRDAEKKEIEKNKNNMKNHLSKMMTEIGAQLFSAPVPGSHRSIVQNFTFDLSSSVEKTMAAMYEQQKNRLEAGLKKLDEQTKMNSEQQQRELIRINNQRKKWLNITTDLQSEEKELQYIQSVLIG